MGARDAASEANGFASQERDAGTKSRNTASESEGFAG